MKLIAFLMLIVLNVVALGIGSALAGNVTIPNKFVAGTSAVADDVNENFDAVATEVNDNNSRITTNATAIQGKQNRVTGTCDPGESIREIAANGSVVCEEDDVGSAPAMPGIEYSNIGNCLGITTTLRNCGSITVTTPTNGPATGYILVQISGYGVTFGESTAAEVGVGDSATVIDRYVLFGVLDGTDAYRRTYPINLAFVYTAGPGTSKTFYLLSRVYSSLDDHVINLGDMFISAIYFPNRY